MHVEVAEPPDVRETLVGLQDTDKPVEGMTDSERATLPVKPPMLATLTVEVPLEPAWKPTVAGFAEIAKSSTSTMIWRECETPPLIPVKVSV